MCRSLKPAKHAGQTLLRHKAATAEASQQLPPDARPSASLQQQPGTPCGRRDDTTGAPTQPEGASEEARGGARLESFPLPDSPERPILDRASTSSSGRAGRSTDFPQDQRPGLSSSTVVRWRGEQASSSGPRTQPGSSPTEPQSAAVDSNGSAGDGQDAWQPLGSRPAAYSGTTPSAATSGPAITIEQVEWHGRIEQDWYAATAMVDLLTFIYVAIFYQVKPPTTYHSTLTMINVHTRSTKVNCMYCRRSFVDCNAYICQ